MSSIIVPSSIPDRLLGLQSARGTWRRQWLNYTNLDISSQDTVSSVCWVPRIFLHSLAGDWYRFAVESWFHSHKPWSTLSKLTSLTSGHSLKIKLSTWIIATAFFMILYCRKISAPRTIPSRGHWVPCSYLIWRHFAHFFSIVFCIVSYF